MSERKIILDPDLLPDDFRATADAAGWELISESPPKGLLALELIYRAGSEGATTVHYIEDPLVKVRYALARGPQADEVAEEVKAIFAHIPDESVMEAAEDESEGLQSIVSWMLSATVLEDQAGHQWLHALIEKRLAHENSAVRRAALISVSWLEWPDFRTSIERMATDDPDEAVRQDAASLAQAYAMRDKGEI
ncbi:MAG TPA: hypothetical protein VF650_14815 [Allosphingosinicella sp.]|jgi:hypothetical protein